MALPRGVASFAGVMVRKGRTAPVVTEHGVHILQYVEDIPGGPVELTDDLMALLRVTLLEPAQTAALNETMSQWMNDAELVFSEEARSFVTYMQSGAEEAAE